MRFLNNLASVACASVLITNINTSAEGHECDIAAFKSSAADSASEIVRIAQLSLITSNNYDEAKKSGSAKIPGYFDGDYNQFAKKRAETFNSMNFTYDSERARSLFTSGLDRTGLDAYVACLRSGSPLSSVVVQSPSRELISLRVIFAPTTAIPHPNPLKLQIVGAQMADAPSNPSPIGTADAGPGEFVFLLKRDKNAEFAATISMPSMNIVSKEIFLPQEPILCKSSEEKRISVSGQHTLSQDAKATVGRAWQGDTCLEADPGWTLESGSTQVTFSRTRDGCAKIDLSSESSTKICYKQDMSINAGETCDFSWKIGATQKHVVDRICN